MAQLRQLGELDFYRKYNENHPQVPTSGTQCSGVLPQILSVNLLACSVNVDCYPAGEMGSVIGQIILL